jgi:predicted transcriptional regulator
MSTSFESLIACFACEVRVSIIQILVASGPMTMGALAAELGVAASTASAHVAELRAAGLVDSWRVTREIYVDSKIGGIEIVLLPHPRDAVLTQNPLLGSGNGSRAV